MPYTPRQTLAATEFLSRLASLHALSDRDARRPGREGNALVATHAFFDLFNIQHDTPPAILLHLARWITNPEAHTFVADHATAPNARCIVGRTPHSRCGRPRRDPRHIAPVIPALADLGTPVLVDVQVTETADGLQYEGRRP